MSIYTRAGDEGFTTCGDGRRVAKSDVCLQASGSLDELNCLIGWCVQAAVEDDHAALRETLVTRQGELMAAGSLLATGGGAGADTELDEAAVLRMEQQIDLAEEGLPALGSFLLPGGCELACRLHLARAVCRRCEARVVAAAEQLPIPPIVLKYLNRLGDLLFMMARQANKIAGIDERTWPDRDSQQ